MVKFYFYIASDMLKTTISSGPSSIIVRFELHDRPHSDKNDDDNNDGKGAYGNGDECSLGDGWDI